MKYQIAVTNENDTRYVYAVVDDLEQAKAKCAFLMEVEANGSNMFFNLLCLKSIELSQVEPIEVYQLDVDR